MGYLHIDNLYKPEAQAILLFKHCYAMEKVHGTSAGYEWDGTTLKPHSGGVKYDQFVALRDVNEIAERFKHMFGTTPVRVFGEAYGGKMQKMADTYGPSLQFIAFEVRIQDRWLSVPDAYEVAGKLGFEFVPYHKIATDLPAIDAERDKPSEVARRRGITESKIREGVVLRPLFECTLPDGKRIMAKHKRAEFFERQTVPDVNPALGAVMLERQAIANEWVTEMRMDHVLDHLGNPNDLASTGKVMAAMVEDVMREAKGEVVDAPQVRKAIANAAAKMYKVRVTKVSV